MPEENNQDPQVEATQDQGEVSTPVPEGATETQEASSSEPSDQAEPSQEIDYKTRYSESSKEARRLYEEKKKAEEELEAIRENTLRFVTSDRQRFVDYLESQDLSADDRQKYIDAYDAQNPPQSKPQPVQPGTMGQPAPLDPYKERVLDEAAERLQRQVESRQKATQRFLDDKENQKLSRETLNAVWPLAFKLETESGLDPDEALSRAKSIIVGQGEVSDQSYAQGLSDALFGNVTTGVVGGSGGSKKTDRLPPEHEQFVQDHIRNEGLTGKAAEDFRRGYVERLAAKRII